MRIAAYNFLSAGQLQFTDIRGPHGLEVADSGWIPQNVRLKRRAPL
jgi:hypothetical protein